MSTVVFRRPPRRNGPLFPEGELVMEPPLELPEQLPRGIGQLLMLLPMVAGVGAMAFMYAGRGGGAGTWVAGGLMGVSMLGMAVGQFGGGGKESKAEVNADRRDYMRFLGQSRKRVRRAAEAQRTAQMWRHPAPEALWSYVNSRRMWERRTTDDDFGEVRLAVGAQQLKVQITLQESTKPIEDLEPMTAIALRRFVTAHSIVPDLPIAASLRAFGRIVLHGDEEAALGMIRAMLAELVVFHAPDDVFIVIVADQDHWYRWNWVKWLPHTQHTKSADGAGARRLVFDTLAEAEAVLGEEISGRPTFNSAAKPLTTQPHIMVIIDGGEVSPTCQLLGPGKLGTTVIDIGGRIPREAGRWLLHLEVLTDSLAERRGNARTPLGRPDYLTLQQAEGLARYVSPYRLTAASAGPSEDPIAKSAELPDLLGVGDAAAVDPAVMWQPRPFPQRLRVPLGLSPDGSVIELDFKEAAFNGMGPHGLIIGATGSGKSELLLTIVTALAATHSPEELNFVLVDFKGGATFASLDTLPHTSALITNLADELTLVDRMYDALDGEMNRRQELLRAAGNFPNRFEYEKKRVDEGAPLKPLPSLLIICDEFSVMLAAKPGFIDLFVKIGRVGRSLGVHQLLASQRLEEGKLRGLDTYLSYRIGLRTFSAVESRIVLGVPDAYTLPNAPGHGYLKTDTETMLRFRGAYVSGRYKPRGRGSSSSARAQAKAAQQILPYEVGFVPIPQVEVEEPTTDVVVPEPDAPQETMLTVIMNKLRIPGAPQAHEVWLPPLAEPPTLDQLMPAQLAVDPNRGLCPAGFTRMGQLLAPVGEVDRPYEQRRDPMWVELDGAGGNVVIVGAPQSGKSTLLRSMICSLAMLNTPREVQFFCLDFGGGALRAVDNLPHVAGVAGRRDIEAVRRTVSEVVTLLDERDARFTANAIDSMAQYRRRRAQGDFADDPFGDVFLVIDGWGTVRTDYEELEATVT